MVFVFEETMSGFVCPGAGGFDEGCDQGRERGYRASISVRIEIEEMERFINERAHAAVLSGVVSVPGLGEELAIKEGTFNLFELDVADGHSEKTMKYRLRFDSDGGEPHLFEGIKHLHADGEAADALTDMTTLYSAVYRGDKPDPATLYAQGILRFALTDTLALLGSMRAEGDGTADEALRQFTRFFDFAYDEVLNIYLSNGLLYRTDYDNLVLCGRATHQGREKDFFFCAGTHNQGFPWGDQETFSDLTLVFSEVVDGRRRYERYLVAGHALPELELDMANPEDQDVYRGRLAFSGDLLRLEEGYQASFSDEILHPGGRLQPLAAKLELHVSCSKPARPDSPDETVDSVVLPFAHPRGKEHPLLYAVHRKLERYFPSRHELGIHLGVRAVTLLGAEIQLGDDVVTLAPDLAWGEAESSTFNFVREPTLYYNYFCAVDPARRRVRVHSAGDVLFNETTRPLDNLFDHAFRALARPFGSLELRLDGPALTRLDRAPRPLAVKDETVLEVNYDHFATGVFQRRVVLLSDEQGRPVFALEEDMKRINLRRIAPVTPAKTDSPLDAEASVVAVHRSRMPWPAATEDPERDLPGGWDQLLSLVDRHLGRSEDELRRERRLELERQDKRELLRKVIQTSGFLKALARRAAALDKPRDQLRVAIKPNFMFAYNKHDHTTYTDPLLVLELVDLLRAHGYREIAVVEAQSSYGNYFQHRTVPEVAAYLGYDLQSAAYSVVDLSDEEGWVEPDPPFAGPLRGQPVHRAWRDADFRVSFAKNKTHCYAYYTLTLKCVYGALPIQNKFKEYHCQRGIYGTTIEYLTRYPVHFGFVDAYCSADGPFGIFADKTPNYTRTLIGGENLVAVDWVGASKMGLDPMISRYMSGAVERFGKPRILLKGDLKEELYTPWENVPAQLQWFASNVLDWNQKMGDIFYSVFCNMDDEAFPRKDDPLSVRLFRSLTRPLRDMFFKNHPEHGLGPFFDFIGRLGPSDAPSAAALAEAAPSLPIDVSRRNPSKSE